MANRTNILIEIADDSTASRGTIPSSDKGETIPVIAYNLLLKNPYTFTEPEYHKELHHNIRGNAGLNIAQYDIRRSPLCKKWGWGIHYNAGGKIALVGCETESYKKLQADSLVEKIKAYNSKKN